MKLEELMDQLKQMGTEQTKSTFIRHGAKEPLFGVKIGDMKKLVKYPKKDPQLALALYETSNSDAMYLAGMSVNPKSMTKELLQQWVRKANWSMLAETTVAGVAAESGHALELAREWIESDEEIIATAGWSTYAGYVSITSDENLDIEEIRSLLHRVKETIHSEKNRVRYTMNAFVIAIGVYIVALSEEAKQVAAHIGKVHVDVGDTACKVPLAAEYITKTIEKGKLGEKRKTCIC